MKIALNIFKHALVLVSLSLGCCKQPNDNTNNISITRTIEIPKQTYSKSGSFYDHSLGAEFIYLTEPVTLKHIRIYDIYGSFVDSIPLNRAISELDEIQSISIISLDTIIISAFISSKIVFLNRYGECYRKINIEDILADSIRNAFEFYPSIKYDYLENAYNLIYRAWPNYHKILSDNNIYTNSMNTNMFNYYKFFHKSPFLFKLDINLDSISYKFGCNDIYKNICEDNYLFDEVPNFKILNNRVFIWSNYSNSLFEVDENSMEINRKIAVNSKYTKTFVNPIKIDTINLEKQLELQQNFNLYGGGIYNVFYNNTEKRYYIIVKHQEIHKNYKNAQKSFSVIVYDDDFKESKEYLMDETKYIYSSAIMLREGLMFITVDTKGSSKKTREYEILYFD